MRGSLGISGGGPGGQWRGSWGSGGGPGAALGGDKTVGSVKGLCDGVHDQKR